MPTIDFSILIPWSNRPEIERTLHANIAWFRAHRVEILLLNCGGDSDHLRRLVADSGASNVRQVEIPRSTFNKSLALNVGIYCSRAARVFVLDADIVLQSDILTEARPFLENNAFVTVGRVFESNLQPAAAEAISALTKHLGEDSFITCIVHTSTATLCFRDGTSVSVPTLKRYAIDGSRAGCGLLLAARHHLVAIGGYNSSLEYWGWEDNDVQLRLKRTLSLSEVEAGEAVHITHGNDLRVLGGLSPMRTNVANFHFLCGRYSAGDFSGTYHEDIALWKDAATK